LPFLPFVFVTAAAGDGSTPAPLLIGGVGECLALSGPGWAGGGGWSRFLRRGARSLLGPCWAGRPIVFVSYKLQISSLYFLRGYGRMEVSKFTIRYTMAALNFY